VERGQAELRGQRQHVLPLRAALGAGDPPLDVDVDGRHRVGLQEQHLGDVAELITDPEVLHHTRIPEPPPEDFPRRWLARYERGRAEGTTEAFAIHDDDGAFAGLALAPTIDREAREMELGYILAPAARGRGLATEAMRELTRWAFDQGALRLVLIIDAVNEPSRRVAERCGYVLEGTMRSSYLKQGRRVDAELWSKLPTDP